MDDDQFIFSEFIFPALKSGHGILIHYAVCQKDK